MSEFDKQLRGAPTEFVRSRSRASTIVWAVLLVAFAVGAVVAIVNSESLRQLGASYVGRRDALRDLVAPVTVVILVLGATYSAWSLASWSHKWRRVSTGARLRQTFTGRVVGGLPAAEEIGRRFATGDPRVYLPVHSGQAGDVWVGAFTADKDDIGFVTITVGKGNAATQLPLITLEGNAYRGLSGLRQDDFLAPAPKAAISGFLDPFLRN